MAKELFVSSTPHETKLALVEDEQLAEVYFERENEYTLAGSIYKGRVTRVLPGMQSAFVDIGLERDAFLYVSDFFELPEDEEGEVQGISAPRPVVFDSGPPAEAAPQWPSPIPWLRPMKTSQPATRTSAKPVRSRATTIRAMAGHGATGAAVADAADAACRSRSSPMGTAKRHLHRLQRSLPPRRAPRQENLRTSPCFFRASPFRSTSTCSAMLARPRRRLPKRPRRRQLSPTVRSRPAPRWRRGAAPEEHSRVEGLRAVEERAPNGVAESEREKHGEPFERMNIAAAFASEEVETEAPGRADASPPQEEFSPVTRTQERWKRRRSRKKKAICPATRNNWTTAASRKWKRKPATAAEAGS